MNDPAYIRTQLYPEIEPYETGRLPLDSLHIMYWEQCGNPAGVPVVFLHGGPGAPHEYLEEPEGPSNVTNSPSFTSRSMPATATVGP